MKIETKNNLKIIVSVILLMAIGALLFYLIGSKAAVMFCIFGIPLLFIAYSYFFVKGKNALRKDPTVILKKQESEKIASDYKDLLGKVKKAHEIYGIDTGNLNSKLEDLAHHNFADVGLIVQDFGDTKTTKFDDAVLDRTDIGNLEILSGELQAIYKEFEEHLRSYTEFLSNKLVSLLDELKNTGYILDEDISNLQNAIDSHTSTSDIQANIQYIESLDSLFETSINTCIHQANDIKHTVEELDQDTSSIEAQIIQAGDMAQTREHSETVNILKSIMSGLESSVSGDFDELKNKSLDTIQTVLNSVDTYSDDNTGVLEELHNKISAITSPSKMSELKQLSNKIIPAANQLVENLDNKIQLCEKKINEVDVPAGFYRSHGTFQHEISTVLSESDLSVYATRVSDLFRTMLPVFEESDKKTRVVVSYSKIEKKIQKLLDSNGFVSSKDIRIKNVEEFLQLFAINHLEVRYNSIDEMLEFIGGRPVYNLKIKSIDSEDKTPLEGVCVTLYKKSDVRGKMDTDSNGEAVFKDVLKGEYRIQIDQRGDYDNLNKKITITENSEIEIKLKKPSLSEKICGDKEESARKSLRRFSNDLLHEMGKNQFITSELSLRIKSDLVPCLLYVWAKENENFKFVELSDNQCMVYDKKVAKRELWNIVSGLERGERENIDDLRDGFFSAPLPNIEFFTLIEELKKESNIHENIKYDDNFIWVE